MDNFLPALGSAIIWAISPIFYRDYFKDEKRILNILKINFLRLTSASSALAIPFFIFGFNEGIIYAALSGAITLALGDTLYFLSIKKIGASIAAPVAYTYVFFIQISSLFVGEEIKLSYFISSILIIFGIFLLSGAESYKLRISGIALSLLTAVIWTIGQTFIKLATIQGMHPISITFTRTFTAALLLSFSNLGSNIKISPRRMVILSSIAVSDIALGSFLYVYSISEIGLSTTVLLTSFSPFATQLFTRILGREKPKKREIVGGLLIVISIILAQQI